VDELDPPVSKAGEEFVTQLGMALGGSRNRQAAGGLAAAGGCHARGT